MKPVTIAKRIGIITNYRSDYGRKLIDAVLQYKFRSASSLWHIVYISDWDEFSFEALQRARIDALIAPIYLHVEEFWALNIPIVNITEPPDDCPFPTVAVDNSEIGKLAAAEFASMELHRCYWMGREENAVARSRSTAFCACLKQHGIPSKELGYILRSESSGSFVGGHPLRQVDLTPEDWKDDAVGIFCITDSYGVEILESCQTSGLMVPDQVAVISVDNDPILCQSAVPELSSIQLQSGEVGAVAAAQLDRMLQGMAPADNCVRIPPKGIVHRHSTYRFDCDDPVVAEALRFIRSHIAHYFDVSDILRIAGLSRSSLEKRFRKQTGTTLHQKIVSERLLRAESMLRETDMLQDAIGSQSGFPNPHAFHKAFIRKHSCTPSQFRTSQKKPADK